MATVTSQAARDTCSRSHVRAEVERVLRSPRGPRRIRRIFWQVLGYDRRDEPWPIVGFDPAIRAILAEARVFASHDGMTLVHLRTRGDVGLLAVLDRIAALPCWRLGHIAALVEDDRSTDWALVYRGQVGRPTGSHPSCRVGSLAGSIYQQGLALSQLKTFDRAGVCLRLRDLVAAYDGLLGADRVPSRSTLRVPHPGPPASPPPTPIAPQMVPTPRPPRGRGPRLSASQERAIMDEMMSLATCQVIPCGRGSRHERTPHPGAEARFGHLRDRLVAANLPACSRMARKFARDPEEYEELRQETSLALLSFLDRATFESRHRLGFRIQVHIRQVILRWIKAHRQPRRRPPGGSPPRRGGRRSLCLRVLIGDRIGRSGDLVDDRWGGPFAEVDAAARSDLFARMIGRLPERSVTILTRRFGLDGSTPRTLEQVARTLHLTRERVRQIEAKSLELLRFRLRPHLED